MIRDELPRRVRIKTWSAAGQAQELEKRARRGDAEWVADILSETNYAGLRDLLKAEMVGTGNPVELRKGRQLAEGHRSITDKMQSTLSELGIAILRALVSGSKSEVKRRA